jgi:hypothetical protein
MPKTAISPSADVSRSSRCARWLTQLLSLSRITHAMTAVVRIAAHFRLSYS